MSAVVEPATTVAVGEVHLWHARLDVPDARLATLSGYLSADELARADRFRFRHDRDRYAAGRGMLRELLAGYLELHPGDVAFRYGRHGRPALQSEEPLAFNVAHSDATVVFAVAAADPVGVDVERCGADALADRVPEHFFSAREVVALYSLSAAEQERAFLRCWTRKEAFLKAQGIGLSLPLDGFAVTLAPDDAPALTWTAWSALEPHLWRLFDVSECCPGYVAAVAAGTGTTRIVARRWPDEDDTVLPITAASTQEEQR